MNWNEQDLLDDARRSRPGQRPPHPVDLPMAGTIVMPVFVDYEPVEQGLVVSGMPVNFGWSITPSG